MVNIGTLFAFIVVCAAVLILRIKRPEAPRPFRCPAVFVVAPLGIVVNLLLMGFLPVDTWMRLVVWLGIGLVIYFAYGYRFSVMRRRRNDGEVRAPGPSNNGSAYTGVHPGEPPQTRDCHRYQGIAAATNLAIPPLRDIMCMDVYTRGALAVLDLMQPDLFLSDDTPAIADSAFAEIVFDRPLDHAYTYAIPAALRDRVAVGKRVLAPFGKGDKPTIGFCVGMTEAKPERKVKRIAQVLDEEPT